MPASVQTPLSSAPEQPFIFSAILVRLIPLVRFMLRLCMRRMSARASTLVIQLEKRLIKLEDRRDGQLGRGGYEDVRMGYIRRRREFNLSVYPSRTK